MKKPKFFKVLSTLAVSTLLLSACGGSGGNEKSSNSSKTTDTKKFSTAVKNDKKEVKDGSLTIGLVSDTPFEGLLDFSVYESNPDWRILTIFNESLLTNNDDWEYTNDDQLHMNCQKIKKRLH